LKQKNNRKIYWHAWRKTGKMLINKRIRVQVCGFLFFQYKIVHYPGKNLNFVALKNKCIGSLKYLINSSERHEQISCNDC
jgi:hypothetical protein